MSGNPKKKAAKRARIAGMHQRRKTKDRLNRQALDRDLAAGRYPLMQFWRDAARDRRKRGKSEK